jgi:hypothetical protein
MVAVMVAVVVGGQLSEAWWAVPLASAPSRSDLVARVCGGTVGTVNVGSHAPVCPPFIVALREGGPLPYKASAPDQGTNLIGFQSGDHIPNILPLDLHISSLLDNPFIHKSVHKAHFIMTVSYILSDTMTTIHLSVSKRILV